MFAGGEFNPGFHPTKSRRINLAHHGIGSDATATHAIHTDALLIVLREDHAVVFLIDQLFYVAIPLGSSYAVKAVPFAVF